MKSLRFTRATACALLCAASAVHAQTTLINFDSQLPNGDANLSAPTGLTFYNGIYLPDLDINFDPIPGSDKWRPDTAFPLITAENPSGYGYGNAPSPDLALQALWSPALLEFTQPASFSGFSVTLDNSSFGTPFPLEILFYASNGSTDTLLASIPVDQTAPGAVGSYAGLLQDVSKIVLPSGAFYDNLTYTTVPEPGQVAASAVTLLGIVGMAWRRRAQRV